MTPIYTREEKNRLITEITGIQANFYSISGFAKLVAWLTNKTYWGFDDVEDFESFYSRPQKIVDYLFQYFISDEFQLYLKNKKQLPEDLFVVDPH